MPVAVARVEKAIVESVRWYAHDHKSSYGVMLSSGVDSALLTATLQRLCGDATIHTFTVGFGDDDPEITGARETAFFLGTNHHEIIVRPEMLTDLLRKTIAAVDNPGGYDEFPCLFALHETACEHVDVIFSGNAADTLFAGMPYHAALLSSDGGLYRRLCDDLLFRDERLAAQELLAAHHGISFRMPYADKMLIDLALEVPDCQKLSNENNKIIFRDAAQMLLPDEITSRPKRIQHLRHDDAMWNWLEEQLDWIHSTSILDRFSIRSHALITNPRRRSAVEGGKHFRTAWNIVSLATWASIFLVESDRTVGHFGDSKIPNEESVEQ
jgi:asparagine synthase (glutamine-hydrolysing)